MNIAAVVCVLLWAVTNDPLYMIAAGLFGVGVTIERLTKRF